MLAELEIAPAEYPMKILDDAQDAPTLAAYPPIKILLLADIILAPAHLPNATFWLPVTEPPPLPEHLPIKTLSEALVIHSPAWCPSVTLLFPLVKFAPDR